MKAKLYLVITLALLLVISISGCSGVPNEKVSVIASDPEYYTSLAPYSEPKADHKYVVFSVEVKNEGKENHHANPNNITLVDINDYSYAYDVATHALESKEFPAVDVRPGSKAAGLIVFQIPGDAEAKKLIYKPMFGNEVSISLK
ncbi:DUF4352 domain-containing protein [Desulforamulus aquiferis]|uniref:DUF4352 domain-containing protein n=1 Tax=Desulforamulus aquiferis TaxID=1397668 RepID=A0AAW7Z980_9FIRM|nr:DUF4352 domain-containing protein [Desulforamulus aquiferis]MDO7786095.1 DUF4352 domain-containing protein [Desulforamulus aquiferis]